MQGGGEGEGTEAGGMAERRGGGGRAAKQAEQRCTLTSDSGGFRSCFSPSSSLAFRKKWGKPSRAQRHALMASLGPSYRIQGAYSGSGEGRGGGGAGGG